MVATLVPWDCEPAHGWAYVDDRSLSSSGPQALEILERGLQLTQEFDTSIGYSENQSKRQMWQRGETVNEIEHLGLAEAGVNYNELLKSFRLFQEPPKSESVYWQLTSVPCGSGPCP